MRLIDADALIDKTDDRYSLHEIGRRERDDIVDALEYAPTIHPEPHWIPVTERLPEDGQEILATTTDNAWGDVVIIRTFYKEMHKSVIAWMSLPEPFKGVTT